MLHSQILTTLQEQQAGTSGKVGVELGVGDSELTKKHCMNLALSAASMVGGQRRGVGDSFSNRKMPIGGHPQEVDEDLHSRPLAVYGRETMRRRLASNVLVSGMQGLSVEIAKNLIPAGVKAVTLHDEGNVKLWDLSRGSNFSEEDLGKNSVVVSVPKLKEPMVLNFKPL